MVQEHGHSERPRKRCQPAYSRAGEISDPDGRDAMVRRHLGLARHLALRYSDSGEPLEDLIQVASLGLVKAVDRFDPERGVAFTTFAVPTILGELRRHFRDHGWAIHVPRDLKDAALRVKGAVAAHGAQGEHGRRAPTPTELAQETGMPVETVLEALEVAGAHRALSLDAPAGGGDEETSALGDLIGQDDGALERAEERALLARLATVLDAREREILRLRFAEDLTQSEIGARIGVSQMQVSRIIRAALTRLRVAARLSEDYDERSGPPVRKGS